MTLFWSARRTCCTACSTSSYATRCSANSRKLCLPASSSAAWASSSRLGRTVLDRNRSAAATPDSGARPVQCAEEVHEVLATPGHLQAGMQSRSRHTVDNDQLGRLLEQGRSAPLLELDHDVRILARAGPHTGQYRVDPHAGQRQMVLDKYLDLVETGVHEILREDRQAALQRTPFGRPDAAPAHPELLGDPVRKRARRGKLEQTSPRRAEFAFTCSTSWWMSDGLGSSSRRGAQCSRIRFQ